jgi:DNA repair photolyase
MLQKQLPRMRQRPGTVYFSTACEPFVAYPQIQEMLYRTMTLLLENSICLLISTKSQISSSFIDLFEEHRNRVNIQVGLTTTDEAIRQLLEPAAPSVCVRIATMVSLAKKGIPFELRADPLIPELTDSDENLAELFRTAAASGTTSAAASFLFIRPANLGAMRPLEYGNWSFGETYRRRYTQTIENYCGQSSIQVAEAAYRRERYERMSALAIAHGLTLKRCRCKNPDVTDTCCHPHMPATSEAPSRTLFDN